MEAVGDGGMTRLYLIRHAEAEGNLYRVAHGHCNGLITNYRGYQQIDALRERFRKVDIDAVYSQRPVPDADHRPGHLAAQGPAAASGAGVPGDPHGRVGGPHLA